MSTPQPTASRLADRDHPGRAPLRPGATDPEGSVSILGVRFRNVTKAEAIALFESWIHERDGIAHCAFIANAHTLNLAYRDAGYRNVLNGADAVFADGTGVRMAARCKGVRLRDNLVGTDLLPLFMERTLVHGHRYFLLGGAPGTAARATRHLRETLPGIRIVGHRHGYAERHQVGDVIHRINATQPDVLLVALGNPLQERWIHTHRPALRVPVSIGVGGLFDHWAGTLWRAPQWVRDLGIEWTQLLLQQPHKWRRYLVGNPQFIYRMLADARDARRRASRNEPPLDTTTDRHRER
jgi:N-acetylglucosaminyldiphosphoundecaprenol N-acetyl-beta-D-mannosaminyltransferase